MKLVWIAYLVVNGSLQPVGQPTIWEACSQAILRQSDQRAYCLDSSTGKKLGMPPPCELVKGDPMYCKVPG